MTQRLTLISSRLCRSPAAAKVGVHAAASIVAGAAGWMLSEPSTAVN